MNKNEKMIRLQTDDYGVIKVSAHVEDNDNNEPIMVSVSYPVCLFKDHDDERGTVWRFSNCEFPDVVKQMSRILAVEDAKRLGRSGPSFTLFRSKNENDEQILNERWLPVLGYEGYYEVSSIGRVRSLDREVRHWRGGLKKHTGRVLKPIINNKGYPVYNLSKDNVIKGKPAHIMVAEAFIGRAPIGKQVAHNDGDPLNPALSNLRYATPKENNRDKIRHGTQKVGSESSFHKLDEPTVLSIRKEIEGGSSIRMQAEKHNVSYKAIWNIYKRRTWKHI